MIWRVVPFLLLLGCTPAYVDADTARLMGLAHRDDEQLKCGTPYPYPVRREGGKWAVVRR